MLRSLLHSGAYSLLATAFSYLLIIFLARAASNEALSAYLYATTWGIMLTLVIDAAADQCSVHFKLAKGQSFAATLTSIFAIKGAILIIAVIIVLLINTATEVEIPLAAFLFVVPAFYLGPVFELRDRNAAFARVLFGERAAFFVLAGGYTLIVGLDAVVYVLYFLVTLGSLVAQVLLLRFRPELLRSLDRIQMRQLVGSYVGDYWSIYAILLAQMGYGHFSRLFVEAKVGLIAFGAVTLAFQLTNAIQVIQTQVDRHFRPRLILAAHDGNVGDIRVIAGRYVVMYLLPLALLASAVSVLSDDIVRIVFGPDWSETADYLRYLSPLIVTVPMLKFLDIAVVATQSQRFNLALNVLVLSALLASLAALPAGRPVPDYLLLVVGFQAVHVLLLGTYIARRLRRAAAAISR